MRNNFESCHLPRCNPKFDKYQPYNKLDNNPLYINILSNHLPNIIRNLPGNISKGVNNLSADETTFNKTKDLYNNTLTESGFERQITLHLHPQ